MEKKEAEAKLSSEAEMIYKKLGHQRYKSLVEDMRKIARKFKERHDRYENIVKEPLTPSTGVNYLLFDHELRRVGPKSFFK